MNRLAMRALGVFTFSFFAGFTALAADAWDLSKPLPITGKNLLPNGDFEKGDTTPHGWQTIDGLTSFWETDSDPPHGKIVRFDTDVLQSQAYEWWARIKEGASPTEAPTKMPSEDPNKFDTLAGLDGVWFFSDFVPIEKGKEYWLTVDAKGKEMMCWLLGYNEKYEPFFGDDAPAFLGYLRKQAGYNSKQRGFEKIPFKRSWKGQLKIGGSNKWRTYSRRTKPFNPTKHTPSVRYVRVLILPFWPPGEYFIDNVKLHEYRKPEEE